MQLLVGLRDTWKCVDVQLDDGCVPCIGGVPLAECNLEPALWFKVLVLDSVCVDCSEHVISWSVASPVTDVDGSVSTTISQAVRRKIALEASNQSSSSRVSNKKSPRLIHYPRSSPHASLRAPLSDSPPPTSPLNLFLQTSPGAQEEGLHSLMAPHERDTSLYQDDLQSLFELAEVLFRVNASCLIHTRGQDVEQRSWLRLLHCYILPLISLHHEDLSAVEQAQSSHSEVLASLDQHMLDNSTRVMELKQELVALREKLLPNVLSLAEQEQCSHEFLTHFTFDLRHVEEGGRGQIQSALRNLDLSRKLSMPISEEMERRLQDERKAGETLLLETLQLRGALETALCMLDPDHSGGDTSERAVQDDYVKVHNELTLRRETGSMLSKKKVLAVSVREALQQTVESLRSGTTTTGVDIGLQGGHSTDVLAEATHYGEYTTLRDKIQKLLQLRSSPASHLHNTFCGQLQRDYFPSIPDDFVVVSKPISHSNLTRAMTMPTRERKKSQEDRRWSMKSKTNRKRPPLPSLQQLATMVKTHFEKVVDALCHHFNDHDIDFIQRAWLCYERLFFEVFGSDFLPLYQAHYAKFCEQLQLNSLSVSILEPQNLNLGTGNHQWLNIFKTRSFEEASRLYLELTDQQCLEGKLSREHDTDFRSHFGGVASDLTSLPLAISPLERLQLLTSAFRKAMAALSELKLKPLLEEGSMDLSLAGVSCDDLLPLLTLILLQLHPSFLANLYLQCCFLDDYIAHFLTAGWHGYSLAAFRSALHVIAEL